MNTTTITNPPRVGASQSLDFHEPNLDLTSHKDLIKLVTDFCKSSKLTIDNNVTAKNYTHFFLANGWIVVRLDNDNKMATFDMFFEGNEESSYRLVDEAEDFFGKALSWNKLSGSVYLERGGSKYLLCNRYAEVANFYKGFQLLHQEKTKYQDLRVYDTNTFGRILSLDGMIQNSSNLTGEEDHYTVDLSNLCLQKGKTYESVLIIGAGDMIIPAYLLKTFDIKKLTMSEIDDRVIENTKKYFKWYESIEQFVKDGRFEINVEDGSKFLKDRLSQGEIYDAIIIDNSDVYLFEGPAANLFTVEFYKNIKSVLKPGGKFCQQVSEEVVKQRWIGKAKDAGFEKFSYFDSNCPEYSSFLPLACAEK